MATLKTMLPWTSTPLIINAPMAGYAGGALASAVTLSGGLGLVGSHFDMDALRSNLETASSTFSTDASLSTPKTLPVGVGLLLFILKLEVALPILSEFKPAVIWLFAAKQLSDYAEWASQIRAVSPDSKIWIQVGSVDAALEIAASAKPDVLVMQGADAGGHGFEKSAGIISLLPEASDALAREGFAHIPLIASGGIVDGRGVAAALALGASGVVMGTRFLAAKETVVHPTYQAAVLEARDGGKVTTRSKVFDELRGPNIWPEVYDGRSLVVQSYADHANGVGIDEIRKLHNEAVQGEESGFALELKGRAAIWAGTGVGLVRKVESARAIVEGVRSEAKEILSRVAKV
ncbi:inosine monophosphate dehydrogenase [Melanomma pulvis-pyrius CBS 109.77]|uniref:Inosine monophosphate dehydrogenase n=1 Tax=Melanomma pulvis-pyrius CBS 109.77 TaxID=1314802 RepID=A0A6A6XNH5_9PLEO|nr:inosine monophosphate dehydrogenase [Melanomma pulvis-pyrius CBS 109.77]